MKESLKRIVGMTALVGIMGGAAHAAPAVDVRSWGKTPSGQDVKIITLTNDHHMTVRVITYGGIIQSVEAPDHNGHVEDLVLGFGTLDGYTKDSAEGGLFFGAIIGRYANRLAHGQFTIDGQTYHTDLTDPPNALHGGRIGFDKHVWALVATHHTAHTADVSLRLVSPNGDQGFPGTLTTTVTYTLGDDNALSLNYHATTDAPTVLNLTNHSYWNLNGEGSGTIENEVLKVNAGRYTPTDATSIPTGELATVAGTPLDFRQPTRIGDRLRSDFPQMRYARGYDHNWIVDGEYGKAPRPAVTVYDPASGRTLEVSTNQPGVQVYTSNSLTGKYAGLSHRTYRQTDAVAIEAEHYPDSPNHPSFPTTELRPGQSFDYTTIFKLGIR